MKKDWNLKGKGLYDYPDIDETIEQFNDAREKWLKLINSSDYKCSSQNNAIWKNDHYGIEKTEDDVKVYNKIDIETLRKKLNDDVRQKFQGGLVAQECEKIINKQLQSLTAVETSKKWAKNSQGFYLH